MPHRAILRGILFRLSLICGEFYVSLTLTLSRREKELLSGMHRFIELTL